MRTDMFTPVARPRLFQLLAERFPVPGSELMQAIQILEWFMWRTSRRTRVEDLWIGAFDGDQDTQIAKSREALALIKLHDPRRYRTLMRDLERIWVLLLPGPFATFNARTWTCRLDQRFVVASTIEEIASVIVHEAAHARLFRRGIDYRETHRARVEAMCTRQQATFAAKIPRGDDLKPDIEAHLALDASNWTEETFEIKHVRGSIDLLRHIRTPEWLVKRFVYLRRLRRHRSV